MLSLHGLKLECKLIIESLSYFAHSRAVPHKLISHDSVSGVVVRCFWSAVAPVNRRKTKHVTVS